MTALITSLPDWMQCMAVIDVETTGLDPAHDRITELGVARFEHGAWRHKGLFVNPEGRKLSARITEVTGITQEQADAAPPFWQAYNEIAPLLYGATPVAYNRSFDRRFLLAAVVRAWPRVAFGVLPPALDPAVPWVDVLPLARYALGADMRAAQGTPYPRFSLEHVATHLGFSTDDVHRADADALLTGGVLLRLYERFRDHGDWSLGATLERVVYADFLRAMRAFFKAGAALPPGVRFQASQCDVCAEVKPGRFVGDSRDSDKNGWTTPTQWYTHAGRTFCSSVCETIERWSAVNEGAGK